MDVLAALVNSTRVGPLGAEHTLDPGGPGLRLVGRSQVRVDAGACEWPARTRILCWHCAHAFDTPPVPRPVGFDPRLRRFTVQGCYCSWGCAAAECKGVQQTGYLTSLHRQVCGSDRTIRCAPPRCMLRAFGGPMGIEEYRSSQEEYRVVPPRLVSVEGVNVQQCPTTTLRTNARVDFSGVSTSNQTLKLRRDKPLPAGRGLISMHARVQAVPLAPLRP